MKSTRWLSVALGVATLAASGPAAGAARPAAAPSRALVSGFASLPDAGLARAGLPTRPNASITSDRYQTWQRVVEAARAPLDVEYKPVEDRPITGPPLVWQPDWAGPVLFGPGAVPMRVPAKRFAIVEGEWTVPFAKPTINCSNPNEPVDGSSLWIAIDGWMGNTYAHIKQKNGTYKRVASTDILQAGSESDVHCYDGPNRSYATRSYLWIEWGGTRNIAVIKGGPVNLPLKAGDKIYLKIAADTTGPDAWERATLWFVNETTGYYLPARTFHSGCFDCGTPYERPSYLVGDTAEWIVEATFYDSINRSFPNTLDDFGNVTMTSAMVTDQNGVTYEPGDPNGAQPNIDWMTWNGVPLSQGGTLLACSQITGTSTTTFSRAPYVIATPGQQGKLEPKPQNCR